MKKLNFLLSAFLLLVTFNVEAKSPPPGTGKADVPANIYIMLDTSGSMGANVPSNSPLKMRNPRDVASDSNGNVYVVEYYNHRIRKYTAAGNYVKTFGGYGRTDGRFIYPTKIAIDQNDNIYVADRNNKRIVKFTSDGTFLKNFPTTSGNMEDVAVDLSGNVYAANTNKIYKWDSNGTQVATYSSNYVLGIDWHAGFVYLAERNLRTILKLNDNLVLQNTWANGNLKHNKSSTNDIAVTSNGIYLVEEGWTARINKYSLAGVYERNWGGYYASNGQNLYYLYGIGKTSGGNILAASFHHHLIKEYNPVGTYQKKWGFTATRMSEAMQVIEKLTSSSDLTKGANFGLQDWASRATQRVKISPTGAATINSSVTEKITVGGVLQNNPNYKFNQWYQPGGGTNLDASMKEAQDYFNHATNSPIDPAAGCQKNFLIVISDGQWYGSKSEQIARSMLSSKGIETLVVGFHSGGNQSHYIKLAKAGGTYPDSPLFSNNWQQLYETMSAYIRSAIASRLTFSAPVVMPNISSGDHIYQSTFEYKNNHQWRGHLSKFELSSAGALGAMKWDAGLKLDAKTESSRKIWTVAKEAGLTTSINNFTTSNLAALKVALWENSGTTPTNDQVSKLIKFTRGIDSYDENTNGNITEKRWKLGDIYNSRLTVVGPTNSSMSSLVTRSNTAAFYRKANNYTNFMAGNTCGGKCSTRREMVYVGANDGMLHAFNSTTGEEEWAFIPPPMLQSLKSVISVTANSTSAIYGVDGSPIVQDVYYDNAWRTILISGMGRGGFGYFALDITNPSIPLFLFAFENKPSDSMIYHWDSSGTRTTKYYPPVTATIDSQYDYSKLGETLSTPVIIPMPFGTGTKWVAAFGAGYNAGVSSKYGSSIYVIDLENQGKVLKRIDLTDVNSEITDSIANAMPADLVSITPDTTSKANYKGAMLYGADLEGKQWKINLTNKGTLYEYSPMFNAEATMDNDRMEFFQITPTLGGDKKVWTFYGTGNQQRLQSIRASTQNRLYGLRDDNFPLFKQVSPNNTASTSLKDVSASGACPSNTDLGWFLDLLANEKITGKLGIFNDIVYASRYTPKAGQICSPGQAALTEHATACGGQTRRTELGDGIATGAVIHNNLIYVGISGKGSGDVKDDQGNIVGKKINNLIVINPQASGGIGGGKITQESWREVY